MKERIEIINRHTDMTVDFTIKDQTGKHIICVTEEPLTGFSFLLFVAV